MKKIKFIFLILIILIVYLIYKGNNYKDIIYIDITIQPRTVKTYSYTNYILDNLKENNKLNKYYEIVKEDLTINDLINYIKLNKKINGVGIKSILRESSIVTLNIGENDLVLEERINGKYLEEKKINNISNKYINLLKELNKYNISVYLIIDNNIKINNKLRTYIKNTKNHLIEGKKDHEISKIILKNLHYK